MVIEPDDMPRGMRGESNWEQVAEHLRLFHVKMVGSQALGVARKSDLQDTETVAMIKSLARKSYNAWYAKQRLNGEWIAKRRKYYRDRYTRNKRKK